MKRKRHQEVDYKHLDIFASDNVQRSPSRSQEKKDVQPAAQKRPLQLIRNGDGHPRLDVAKEALFSGLHYGQLRSTVQAVTAQSVLVD